MSDIVSKDGTPNWAYDEDGYCVCCGNGHWKHHMPECELRDSLDAARKYANPNIEAATAITNQLRFAKTSDDWDDLIYDITKEAVDAALGVTEDAHKHDWVDSILGDGQVCQVGDCGAFQSGVTEISDG